MLTSGLVLAESSGSASLNLFENLYISIFKINLPMGFLEVRLGTVGLE